MTFLKYSGMHLDADIDKFVTVVYEKIFSNAIFKFLEITKIFIKAV